MNRLILWLVVLGTCSCEHMHFHGHDNYYDNNNVHGHGNDHGHGFHHHGHGRRHSLSHNHWNCENHNHGEQVINELQFNRLSTFVIFIDRYANNICRMAKNGKCEVQEVYENSMYKLIYTAPGLTVESISVKINHRVIYMSTLRSGAEDQNFCADLRILPDMLNTSDASWQYRDNFITVSIPYKTALDMKTNPECLDITDKVVTVNNMPALDVRFGNPDSN